MIRRPPRSTQSRSSAASDVYKRKGGADQSGNLGISEGLDKDRGGTSDQSVRGATKKTGSGVSNVLVCSFREKGTAELGLRESELQINDSSFALWAFLLIATKV